MKDFGSGGRVNLHWDHPLAAMFSWTASPVVVNDVVVVAGATAGAGDGGVKKEATPEDIRGFDARSGKLRWTFHVVPHAGEYGADSWGEESYAFSGDLASWCCLSSDADLGHVYIPTSAPTGINYGGHRPGDNLYSDSILALDVQTGKRVWHFQTVHHDLWDYDTVGPPTLGDITVNGRRIKALMQPSKTGFLYVFDRVTGTPVWPIEERPVPQSTVPGEHTTKTQPFPSLPVPFDRQGFTEDDLIDYTPELKARAKEKVKGLLFGPLFSPPALVSGEPGGVRGQLIMPGGWGSGNWHTGAFDPETQIYYAVSHTQPGISRAVKTDDPKATMAYATLPRERRPEEGPPPAPAPWPGPDLSIDGLPIFKGPYGRITAIDMKTGGQVWMAANGDGPRSHPLIKDLNLPPLKLTRGVFFDRETFGVDRTVAGEGSTPWPEFLARSPLSEAVRRDIARLYEADTDYMPGLSTEEKQQRLRRISHRDYLLTVAKVDPGVIPFFQTRTHGYFARGIDAISALTAYNNGLPGYRGLGFTRPASRRDVEPYIFHFPEGNAGVARLIVRQLIPSALPGTTMEDSVTARLDYARLDASGQPTRLRLNSTVVRARHDGDPARAADVDVVYVRGGKAERIRARACILACYNAIIPSLCPEMPAPQRSALAMAVKAPLVYTNVLIRDWTAFHKLGVSSLHAPGGFHSGITLDFPVSLGDYKCPRTPEEPMILHLTRLPARPGLPARDQCRAGRAELLQMPFATFERETRAQLARALGGGGFDPARDIAGITVNRWPHGYAQGQNSLWDPDWSESERPWIVGRARFGRISIANSDAAATPLTQAAIAMGHRAVEEVLRGGERSQPPAADDESTLE